MPRTFIDRKEHRPDMALFALFRSPAPMYLLGVAIGLTLAAVPSSGTAQSAPGATQSDQQTGSSKDTSRTLTICQQQIGPPSDSATVDRTEGEVSNVVQALSQQIYSPYCPGKTLSMCPSGGAAAVRRDIQRLARAGWSTTAIREAILDACGEEYRLKEPPTEDNYLLMAAVLAGLLLCLFAVWYFSRPGDDSDDVDDVDEDSLDARDRQRLDDIRHEYRE